MSRYVLRRIGYAVIVVWAAFTATFLLLFILPSDPISLALEQGDRAGRAGGGSVLLSEAQVDAIKARYGYDKPVPAQYGIALGRMVTGDLGTSISTGVPVRDSFVRALPETVKLASTALVVSVIAGVALAVASNYSRFRWLRQALQSLPPLGAAIPTFWFGLILLQIFSFRYGLFPPFGNGGIDSLVLPAITLALPVSAVFAQVLSKSLRDVLDQPYIATARAKGASHRRVHFRHALRNAVIPALTVVGITAGNLLAGSVVVETVFARSGIGRLTHAAVNSQDTPTMLAIVVLSAAVFAIVNLLVDLAYLVVDPRIRRVVSR